MKYIVYFFAIVLLLGLNVGVFSYLKVSGTVPNLLLILVMLIAMDKEEGDLYFIAFVSGLFLDFYAGTFLGSFTFALLLFGLLFKVLRGYILMLDTNWKSLLLVLAGAVGFVAVFVRLYGLAVWKLGWTGQFTDFQGFGRIFVVEFCYNLLLLYPMLYFARFLRYVTEDLLAKNRKMM